MPSTSVIVVLSGNMERAYFFFIFITLLASHSDAAECVNGWVAYKDELCLKWFPNVLTYAEAKVFCASQGTEGSKSTLVMVKEPEIQELLANYTQELHDYVWLGGTYDINERQYRWEDGDALTYTNWQEGYPRNITDSETCIELRPINARKMSTKADGRWADVHCEKRNMVMCQRQLSWTLEDAVKEIIKNRKEFEAKLEEATNERNELRRELETVSSKVVPVGSIYIEYHDQPSPINLWPTLAWLDVTETYGGLFFRAQGGNSGDWGEIQSECAPRVNQMEYSWKWDGPDHPFLISIPSNGWSRYGQAGVAKWEAPGKALVEGLRLHTQTCEVRPTNQAIRLWKRTA